MRLGDQLLAAGDFGSILLHDPSGLGWACCLLLPRQDVACSSLSIKCGKTSRKSQDRILLLPRSLVSPRMPPAFVTDAK